MGIADRFGRELPVFLMSQQHHVDRIREAHHRRRLVAELRVLLGTDGFVEGDRPGEVRYRQVHENGLGHRSCSWCGESFV
ncbi:MAG TPA: hypothetical protein VGB48_05065 [Allosphingosinicella sp.]|jgi:hypothetical protein